MCVFVGADNIRPERKNLARRPGGWYSYRLHMGYGAHIIMSLILWFCVMNGVMTDWWSRLSVETTACLNFKNVVEAQNDVYMPTADALRKKS